MVVMMIIIMIMTASSKADHSKVEAGADSSCPQLAPYASMQTLAATHHSNQL